MKTADVPKENEPVWFDVDDGDGAFRPGGGGVFNFESKHIFLGVRKKFRSFTLVSPFCVKEFTDRSGRQISLPLS